MVILPITLEKSFLRQRLFLVRLVLKGQKRSSSGLAKSIIHLPKNLSPVPQLPFKDAPSVNRTQKSSIAVYSDTLSDNEVYLSEDLTVSGVRKRASFSQKVVRSLSVFFVAGSLLLLATLFFPVVYYHFFPSDPVPVQASEPGSPLGGEFAEGTHVEGRDLTPPPYDESLPEGNWLIIPRTGVHTQILESEKSEDSLNKGVWRVPEYGMPGEVTKPMILAAHRYGYVSWWKGSQYWKYNSFYLLPELEPGDLVIVISGKRKYMYEIYAGEEGEEITDYQADLILYTCKFLNSPLRHFRYARFLDPNSSTQSKHSQASKN